MGNSPNDNPHNPKSELVSFCQWLTGRTMRKNDIVYNVVDHNGVFQATVTLNCLNAVEQYVGNPAMNDKMACQAAAVEALKAHELEISIKQQGMLPPDKEPALKRSKLSELGNQAKSVMLFHECVETIVGRELEDGDIRYQSENVQGSGKFISTLCAPIIPGEMSQKTWVSELADNKRDSKVSAAFKAIEELRKSAEFLAILNPTGQDDEDWWNNNHLVNFRQSQLAQAGQIRKQAAVTSGIPEQNQRTAKRRESRARQQQRLLEGLTPEERAERARVADEWKERTGGKKRTFNEIGTAGSDSFMDAALLNQTVAIGYGLGDCLGGALDQNFGQIAIPPGSDVWNQQLAAVAGLAHLQASLLANMGAAAAASSSG